MITYSQLIKLKTFDERLNALLLHSYNYESPRANLFSFYKSWEWEQVRKEVIKRDLAQDLAVNGIYIQGKIFVHHIQPVTYEDLVNRRSMLFDPENLITVSLDTHNIIHYGKTDESIERKPGDTIFW